MTAVDRPHLRSLLPHLPRDVAGHILADGTSEVMAGPRDVYGYRSRTVMSWLEEDGGLRPTPERLDAICAAVDAFPALLDALDAAEGTLERVRDVIEAGRPNPTSDVYEMGYRAGLEAIAAVLPSTKTAATS